MAKLHNQLEQLFQLRCNSNGEIIAYMKKLSEMGKFDEPKKTAVLAIILDRLGKMEDERLIAESLKTDEIIKIGESGTAIPINKYRQVTEEEAIAIDTEQARTDTPQEQPSTTV